MSAPEGFEKDCGGFVAFLSRGADAVEADQLGFEDAMKGVARVKAGMVQEGVGISGFEVDPCVQTAI